MTLLALKAEKSLVKCEQTLKNQLVYQKLAELKRSPNRILPDLIQLPPLLQYNLAHFLDSKFTHGKYKFDAKMRNRIRNFNETFPFTIPYPDKHWLKGKAIEIENSQSNPEQVDNDNEDNDYVDSSDFNVIDRKLRNVTYHLKRLNIHLSGRFKTWTDEDILLYTMCRAERDYAAVFKVISELLLINPGFSPQTFLDFKSKSGYATWAGLSALPSEPLQTILFDKNPSFQNTSRAMFTNSNWKSIFHKISYPSTQQKYDLVVSSHNLFSVPSLALQRKQLSLLWKVTGKYLVLIEGPNKANFDCIAMARKYLLEKLSKSSTEGKAFIVAPCLHQLRCPLMRLKIEGQVCGSQCKYESTKLLDKSLDSSKENYSYLIVEKKMKRQRVFPDTSRIIDGPNECGNGRIFKICTYDGFFLEKRFPQDNKEMKYLSKGDLVDNSVIDQYEEHKK